MKVNWNNILGIVLVAMCVSFVLQVLKTPVFLYYALMIVLGMFWPYPVIEPKE